MPKIVKNMILSVIIFFVLVIVFVIKQLNFDPSIRSNRFPDISSYFTKNYLTLIKMQFENPNETNIRNTDILSGYNSYCLAKHQNCNAFDAQQFFADISRVGNVQYIGKFIFRDKIDKFDSIIRNINYLAPRRYYPYILTQTIGPIPDTSNVDDQTKLDSWYGALAIGENGLRYNCDANKLAVIESRSESDFLSNLNNSDYANPCPSYELAHQMGFNYFYYLKDLTKSASRYRISAMHTESPPMAKTMPAIASSSLGDNAKAMMMRYDRILNTQDDISKSHNVGEVQKMQKDLEYYTKKAIFSLSLDMIQLSENLDIKSGNSYCQKSLGCLISSGYRGDVFQDQKQSCKDKSDSNQVRCVIFGVGVQLGFVSSAGPVYPFNDDASSKLGYARDNKKKVWWIGEGSGND